MHQAGGRTGLRFLLTQQGCCPSRSVRTVLATDKTAAPFLSRNFYVSISLPCYNKAEKPCMRSVSMLLGTLFTVARRSVTLPLIPRLRLSLPEISHLIPEFLRTFAIRTNAKIRGKILTTLSCDYDDTHKLYAQVLGPNPARLTSFLITRRH